MRDGVLFTPPSAFSILPGITRDSVIQIAREQGIEVREQALPREALYVADEVFFTGTAAEVTPVRSVDKYTVGEGQRGPVTSALQTAYFAAVRDAANARGWLTFVPGIEAGGDGTADALADGRAPAEAVDA